MNTDACARLSDSTLRHGEVVQTWGDLEYTDMTFRISKSYLAL